MAAKQGWIVRLADTAEADFQDILRWTTSQFGLRQARVYTQTLTRALTALADGPNIVGAKPRDDIARGLFSLHVARHGRKGRHFVIFQVDRSKGSNVIAVLRILHDAMDLQQHLPPPGERPDP